MDVVIESLNIVTVASGWNNSTFLSRTNVNNSPKAENFNKKLSVGPVSPLFVKLSSVLNIMVGLTIVSTLSKREGGVEMANEQKKGYSTGKTKGAFFFSSFTLTLINK